MSRLFKKRRTGWRHSRIPPINSVHLTPPVQTPVKKYDNHNSRNLNLVSNTDDNRPYVEVSINGHKVKALLDSGAQSSVVGRGFVEMIQLLGIPTKHANTAVKTADGTLHVIEMLAELPILFNGHEATLQVLVAPNISRDLILGMDFWETFRIRPVICESIERCKVVPVSDSCDLSVKEAKQLSEVLSKMPFSREGELSKTNLITHTINTGNAVPIKQRQYIVSPYIQKEINLEIDRLLSKGVIFACPPGAWNNPVVAVRKATGKIRLCLDARKLNKVTLKDAYPMQQINRILSRLGGTRVLSSIDFSDAYLQVPLDRESQPKTAFSISGRGYFAYARMPFGLCNSGATLCRLVDSVIGCDLEPKVFVYLDDIIVATESLEEHLEVLEKIACIDLNRLV